LLLIFLSRVFIGNTKTISPTNLENRTRAKERNMSLSSKFYWSDMCHTHIRDRRRARTRAKDDSVHLYMVHMIYMVHVVQRYTCVNVILESVIRTAP
jgi:hypothetical protein